MQVSKNDNSVTVDFGTTREFLKIEDYTGSGITPIQTEVVNHRYLTLTFSNYRLYVTAPLAVTLRSVFATLNRFDDIKEFRPRILEALLEVAKKNMRLDEFADKLILEELMFYLAYPIVFEAHSLSAVTETMSKYLDGSFDPLNQFTTRERINEIFGASPPSLLEVVNEKMYRSPTYRRVIFESPETYASFTKLFAEQGDPRFLIRTEDRTVELVKNQDGSEKAAGQYRMDVILWNYYQIDVTVYKEVENLRKIFSLDHMVKILKENKEKALNFTDESIEFLKEFGVKTQLDLITADFGLVRDTASQWNTYKVAESIPETLKASYPTGLAIPSRWKDVKELHDKISKSFAEIKAEATRMPINYTETESLLNMTLSNGMKMKLPKDTAEIVYYGQTLRHCIAGYADRAVEKQLYLLAIYDGEELKYNVELNKGNDGLRIGQFKGERNCDPVKDVDVLVRKAIEGFNKKNHKKLLESRY